MRTEPLRNFIDLDLDKEEHHKEEILNLTAKVSILRMEVIKWKIQVEEYQRGIISLSEHRKIIRGLEENWVEERMTQRIWEEELQSNLRELKKFQFMQKEKEKMYVLSQELLGTRIPSSSYPFFLFE